MIQSDLLNRKETHFVLWRPRHTTSPPQLVIGKLRSGNPPTFVSEERFDLQASANKPDHWEIAASQCNLTDGEVYHYWFAVQDASPASMGQAAPPTILCTDPTAWTVDWRLLAPRLPAPFGEDDRESNRSGHRALRRVTSPLCRACRLYRFILPSSRQRHGGPPRAPRASSIGSASRTVRKAALRGLPAGSHCAHFFKR